MSHSADFRLEQAIYGSRSGDRDYRILAASPGVARADRDLLEQHANLGGTALTAERVEPIYSAFPLDPKSGRQAFARAVVLGRGGRGNDYLVHALILSPALLETLRGDLFLLDQAGLFGDRKPEGDELPARDLDPADWELASRRACGADRPAEIGLLSLAPFLAGIAEGPLAVQVAEGSLAVSLCRALLSALPPDDRVGFFFCSRFCQPRALPYRFSAFVPEDRPLADRYLRGAVRPLASPAEGPIAEWLAAAQAGMEPVSGLSLLRDPAWAVAQVRLLAEPAEAPRRARDREGVPDRAAGPLLDLEIARHPANAPLARVSVQLLGLLAHSLELQADAALKTEDPAALFAEGAKALEKVPAAELIAELRYGSGLAARTAEIAVALSTADPAPFRAIFGPADRKLAAWLEELLLVAPGFALPFLALAFSRWRELSGGDALTGIMALLAGLPADVPLHPALAAIERAAPPAATQGAERRAWFHSTLKWLLPLLGSRVPAALAARLAAQEGLIEEMAAGDLLPLVPELSASFPHLLVAERLAVLPDPALQSFVLSAARGLRFASEGGEGWDLARFPERTRLAERLAGRSAERLLAGASRELARGALALVQAAAGRAEIDGASFRAALGALLALHPAGLTAPAVRVAARWRRRFGPLPRFDPRELAAIRAQACRDARESAPRGKGWPVLIWLAALAPGSAETGRLA